ncbi:MAG: recombinase family protein [Deltaproteobacteria bacterium]|nr:recombinase family protein [Deltaproteobacteria bacterium]MBF0525428.1 recombinase family protein [Deltaproteobacteria bacterium]
MDKSIDMELIRIKAQMGHGFKFWKINKALLLPWIQARRAEGMSYYSIAKMLNQSGVYTVQGRELWGKSTVQGLLDRAAKKAQEQAE